ncbi:hypothetical protein WR164_03630 [Philodulcilactobacillus myokoensis]|uniref:GW domain-containing protein n=1 Tax=Philodulcilactobacillus myokoensis TaxID=2929573 RepID=A0A9W6AZQ2_9LACO|nr:C39 family peptidase [Philodulcilactobacillus myokoensis]GLB46384.1 hypothetical protein WR164_03630 [Philodulcilactobacillus myokoensis]
MHKINRILLMGFFIILGLLMVNSKASANSNYSISSARNYDARVINGSHWKMWEQPYVKGTKVKRKASGLSGQLMQVNEIAQSNRRTYFKVSRKGTNYGWINAEALKKPSTYILPYTYNSQLYPTFAPNACEAISLKTALSVKGRGFISTKSFIDKMPRSNNPKYGFRGNPFKHNPTNVSWTILPYPLAKYGREYDKATHDISGASRTQLISEVKHDNAVAFAGSRNMNGNPTGHMLTIVGYKYGAFLIADPYKYASDSHKVFWVSTTHFMNVYNKCHQYAVVVR